MEVRAKKALGQHFLTDQGIARSIVDALTVGEVRDRSGKCRECEFIDRCFGGCRNAALMAGDDYYGVDPSICEFFKNGWDKRIREVADPAFEEYIKRCPPKGKGKPKEESAEECP